MDYHIPVLLKESIEGLNIQPDGQYVDATFGGGGHSREIIKNLGADGHLYAYDQDQDVLTNLFSENERFTFIPHNFRHLKRFLRLHGTRQVDGILADLGVSSHQIDTPERGFSYRFDANLDMRMNRESGSDAAHILKHYSAAELQRVFSQYGEVRNAKTLAEAIVEQRRMRPIETVGDFVSLLDPLVRGTRTRYLSQVFQALRIEVNEEMEALREFLQGSLDVLKPGGRLVIISYHSLEDRLVKHFFRSGNFSGVAEKDFYGHTLTPFRLITRRAIQPSEDEIGDNNRARSARLRIAEKIDLVDRS